MLWDALTIKAFRNYFRPVDIVDSLQMFGNIVVLQIFAANVSLNFMAYPVKRHVIPLLRVLYTFLESFILTFIASQVIVFVLVELF